MTKVSRALAVAERRNAVRSHPEWLCLAASCPIFICGCGFYWNFQEVVAEQTFRLAEVLYLIAFFHLYIQMTS
jgi:hypothetical protein